MTKKEIVDGKGRLLGATGMKEAGFVGRTREGRGEGVKD